MLFACLFNQERVECVLCSHYSCMMHVTRFCLLTSRSNIFLICIWWLNRHGSLLLQIVALRLLSCNVCECCVGLCSVIALIPEVMLTVTVLSRLFVNAGCPLHNYKRSNMRQAVCNAEYDEYL